MKSDSGDATAWVASPPSDQETKSYVIPFKTSDAGALSDRGAAYQALGLHGWHYDKIECDEPGLPRLLQRFALPPYQPLHLPQRKFRLR